ncbi:hypothetical protein [Nocardia sp. NPDC051570]|uniref:bestrophin-like domain n=1 Tax=Nocardia sp. NPDC051570 TaxID=3364324 RepID=UPI003795AE57
MVLALIVAVVSAAVAVLVFVVGARVWPKKWQRDGHEIARDQVLDLITTFFVAVVAFVVVLCWQQYDNAENHTINEAKGLVATYWIAHSLPEPAHTRIQGLVRQYTQQVLGPEWTLMDREKRLGRLAQETLSELHDAIAAVPVDDPTVADLRGKAFDSVQVVVDARQDRAIDADRDVPEFLVLALYVGTVLVLLSPVLSGIRVSLGSALMIGLLGIVIGSVLLQIHNLERPFSGQTQVPRSAFENAMATYQQIS